MERHAAETVIKKKDLSEAKKYIDGLAQDCSSYISFTVEIPQACTKPSICIYLHDFMSFCERDGTGS